jgi:hypothetical protein
MSSLRDFIFFTSIFYNNFVPTGLLKLTINFNKKMLINRKNIKIIYFLGQEKI